MARLLPKKLWFLLVQPKGCLVVDDAGAPVGMLPEGVAGPERHRAWVAALRELGGDGLEAHLVLDGPNLEVFCQDVPYLTPREQAASAGRIAVSQGGTLAATTLDVDPEADGGHVLWVVAAPPNDLREWSQTPVDAGLTPVHATPFFRALAQGLRAFPDLPRDKIVLTVGEGGSAHLVVFCGASLPMARVFHLQQDEEVAGEQVFEEVNRILQFFKQKNRNVTFGNLLVVGSGFLSKAIQDRLRTVLRLPVRVLAPELAPLLVRGAKLEASAKGGINLVPLDIQEARQRRVLKGFVWGSAGVMLALLGLAGLTLLGVDRNQAAEADRAEQTLAAKVLASAQDERVLLARLPLIRLRMAETRQAEAQKVVGRLAAKLFQVPAGIQLERLEILETESGHRFSVVGVASTGPDFSVGPVAQYLRGLADEPGVKLAPLRDVDVSDLSDLAKGRVAKPAVTHFRVEGTTP
jgi:hypothetical protein